MSEQHDRPPDEAKYEQMWRTYMTTGILLEDVESRWHNPSLRPLVRRLPIEPRCPVCYYPFEGIGGQLAHRLLGIQRSRLNPRLCNVCELFAETHQGGAEVELSMFDVTQAAAPV